MKVSDLKALLDSFPDDREIAVSRLLPDTAVPVYWISR